jgi:GTP-binding protein
MRHSHAPSCESATGGRGVGDDGNMMGGPSASDLRIRRRATAWYNHGRSTKRHVPPAAVIAGARTLAQNHPARKAASMNYNTVEYERSFGTSSQLTPSEGPEIAFAGRSNVGKSSLLNKLFNRKKLAYVSSTPGKTATINFFRSGDVRFVDLPGYGYAQVSKSERGRWSELIEGYFNQDRNFALVASLIDIRHPATDLDETMVGFLLEADLPFCIVLTKGDKLSHSKRQAQKAALARQLELPPNIPLVVTSSLKGSGMDDLRAVIDQAIAAAEGRR